MRRIIAMLLAIVMLVGNVPVQVFATEGDIIPCSNANCTYEAGHEGNCSDYVAPEPEMPEVCGTNGCEYAAGHEGNCSNYVACDTEGCEYAAGHEGNCSNYVACDTEGCEYAAGHEGNCSNFVACDTEGCEYASGHEGNCSNYVACDTEGCEYAAGHEGNCSNFVACDAEGCEYASGHEGKCSNSTSSESQTIAVKSVSMEQLLTLTVGQNGLLTAVVEPENATDKTVTWNSSDPTVAIVEDGTVTPLAEGRTVITAAAGEHSAVCKVFVRIPEGNPVMPASEEVTEISDQAGLAAMASAAGSYQLTADIVLDSSWTAITLKSGTVFDGNGYTITLNGAPLFAKTNNGDTVRNVILEGTVTGSTSIGSLAVIGNGTIRNCASYADVTYTGTGTDSSGWMVDYAAGLVGSMTSSNTLIDNCLYAGSLSLGGAQVYGSVANRQAFVSGTISNCIGVGSDRVGSDEGFNSHTAIDTGTNTVIADASGFAAENYTDILNANLQSGDLTWGLDTDGNLVPGGTGSDAENPGGSSGEGGGEGDGEEEEPAGPAEGYIGIYTQEDLAKLATAGKYQLMNDITLENWTSLNTSGSETIFDGNGHIITLSGKPLFSYLKTGAVVRNLILDGSASGTTTASLSIYIGAATVENCASYADVTSTGGSWDVSGGLIANANSSSAVISNCLYAGTFTAGNTGTYGSIVNYGYGATPTVENCIGVGCDRLASSEQSCSAVDTGESNRIIENTADFVAADYVTTMNANIPENCLSWGLDADGNLVPGGTGSDAENPGGGSGEGEEEDPIDPDAATAEDLAKLNEAIDAAEDVAATGKVYVPDTLTAFQTALSAAKDVAAAANQTKTAVTKAISDLTAAKEALAERSLAPVDLSDQEVISITTADRLEDMQDGKYYRLDADITLGQYWFASTEKTMNSVLDGNGHTITLIGKPLWKAIGPNGVVQNLGILGSAQFGGNDTGAFAQNCEGLILNCWSRVTVNSEGQNGNKKNTGGFVANLKSGGAIVNSYVAGSISMKGTTGNGVQGVFAGTSEANTMVKNGYWLNTVSGNAVGAGDAAVTGCATKERTDFYSETFLNLLNSGKGENGKTWTVNSEGWAHLGEDANYEPPKAINLVYTPSEGYGSGTVRFTDEGGLQLSLKDCLPDVDAELAQFAGRFSYPDFDGEVVFVPQYGANGLGGHTVFASEDGGLEVLAAGSLEIGVYDKASKDETYNEYHTKLTTFTVTVNDIQVKALRLVPTGEKVTRIDDDNYSVAGSASVSLKTEIQVENEWKRASSSLITFDVTGADNSLINGSLYAKETGDMNVTASYKGKSDTVKITSAYVPVTSITPSPNGTYVIHGRNANASTDGQFLDLTLSHGAGTVVALPENASYRNSWELTISDESIAYFGTSYMTAIVPVKAGTVTLTAKSTDPKLESTVTGTSRITLEYFNPLETITIANNTLTVKENESIDLPLTFSGPKSGDGYHVTEPGMTWTFSGDGKVEIVREPLVMEGNREETDEYFVANDQYKLNGFKAGTVTVTGTAADTTNGEKKIQFTVTVESGEALTPADNDKLIAEGISGAQKYLKANAPEEYELGYEWDIFSLIRSGEALTDVQKQVYLNSVKAGVGTLTKPTDLARVALALRVLGEDPENFAGQNLMKKLYNSNQITNTSNEAMYALIALDMDKYNVPKDATWTREKLIEQILKYQNSESGGFGLNNADSTSVDMTAMAIQALSPYYKDYKDEVDQAVAYLKEQLNSSCGFGNAEADAQVLVAMAALGIDILDEDNGFVRNVATNLITDITSYQDPDSGGFLREDKLSQMPTLQSLYGLDAYRRFRDKEDKLFDLSNIPLNNPSYRIVQGGNSTWQRGSAQTVTMIANGPLDKFSGVKVGGTSIDQSWYTKKAVEQGTSVTLTDAYLQTKVVGKYSVVLIFSDGEAQTLLTVTASDREIIDRVKERIDKITLPITKDSETVIENAEKAYEDLTDAQKKLFKETYPGYYKKLTDARKTLDELLSKITVSVSVYGHYKHDSDEDGEIHSQANGGLTLWGSGKVTVKEGATVLEAIRELLKQKGMSCSVTHGGNYIASITKGGTTLGEFTNGKFSGWYYDLNGRNSSIGVGENTVSDGDSIVVHYTDNYTGVSPATEVTKVIALIKAIKKPVTLDSKDEIEKARAAYDKLTPVQKKKVTNYADLEKAEEELEKLLIKEVETLINQIGTVTLASSNKLGTAWNAYNALTPAQQLKVTNRAKLFAAEKTYNTLRAEEVQKLIDAIKEPVTLDGEADIVKARKAYDALSEAQKALLKKEYVDKLKAAELALAELQSTDADKEAAQKVADMIEKLGVITLSSEEDVAAARKAYDSLTEIQKKLVTNYDALLQAETRLRALKSFQKVESMYQATGDYLERLGVPDVGSVGGEWMVIGLARSNRTVREEYYDNVLAYVDSNIDENGRLHPVKSTDNSRLILALTAIDKDVTDVGGKNLLMGLNDMEYVCKQGINGPIYALLALDCGNYPVPMQGDVTRKALLRTILDAQLADGGWALSGEKASPDMTAMALQALAPYCSGDEEIAVAVERGLNVLSQLQNADGSYVTVDGNNSESLAQVVIALTALGIDPVTDARFIKNDISLLDALAEFYVTGGGFKHLIQGRLDGMATEQAYIALAAYYRFLMGDTDVFNMTDVVNMGGDVIVEEITEALEMIAKPAAEETQKNPVATILIVSNIVTISVAAVALYFLFTKKRF